MTTLWPMPAGILLNVTRAGAAQNTLQPQHLFCSAVVLAAPDCLSITIHIRLPSATYQSLGTLLEVGHAPLEKFISLKRPVVSGPLCDLERQTLQFLAHGLAMPSREASSGLISAVRAASTRS